MMRRLGAGYAIGVDLSAAMVARAHRQQGVGFAVAADEALPFRDSSFTRVLSVEALYYAADIDTTLRETRRVCTPGGRFVCIVDLYKENPGAHGWIDVLEVKVQLLSAAEYVRHFRAAGFARADATQMTDRRPILEESEFQPDRWFRTYAAYRTYRELGGLVIDAQA